MRRGCQVCHIFTLTCFLEVPRFEKWHLLGKKTAKAPENRPKPKRKRESIPTIHGFRGIAVSSKGVVFVSQLIFEGTIHLEKREPSTPRFTKTHTAWNTSDYPSTLGCVQICGEGLPFVSKSFRTLQKKNCSIRNCYFHEQKLLHMSSDLPTPCDIPLHPGLLTYDLS